MKCNLEKWGYKTTELNLSNGEFDMAIENGLLRVSYDSSQDKMWMGITATKFESDKVIDDIYKIALYAMEYQEDDGFNVFAKNGSFYIENLTDGETNLFFYDLTPDSEIKSEFVKMAREYADSAIGV